MPVKRSIAYITCIVDNHSLFDAMMKSTKFVSENRLRLEISNINERLKTNQVREVCWTNTKDQLADCLTKKGASQLVLIKALSEGVWHIIRLLLSVILGQSPVT